MEIVKVEGKDQILAEVFLDDRGFCRINFKGQKKSTTPEDTERIIDAVLRVCGDEPTLTLTDTRDALGQVGMGVRGTIRNHRGLAKIKKAEAFLVNSLPFKLVAQFYIKVNRPPNPARVFEDEEKAIAWLLSHQS